MFFEDTRKYVSPEIKVVGLKNPEIMCTSGDTTDYDNGIWTW